MSFGLPKRNTRIEKAIADAEYAGIILFAAASNYGGNKYRSFPASDSKVICMHVTDGEGVPDGMNPSPLDHRDNFSTLGAGIESNWNGKTVCLAGTSFSTPVAVGIAANTLAFVKGQVIDGRLNESDGRVAHTCDGMRKIFLGMSQRRHGYDYVVPWHWDWFAEEATVDGLCHELRKTLR
ncbi:hypothetical protein NKR23_g10837 [Pleurostoma richardsiae]|uniref:Peptidase S8/S53 domain-containing protein n=1 Tax=Pleurostoma richardsiae TaxID=41990 RepID=A0AA38R293_9PEZI|nr:hypothetical protein NKR23_g10837 [Pleurostoma richardsiae]